MNRQQFLLIKLAEEATEVAQRALKTSQFGMKEVEIGQNDTNQERLLKELNDLIAVVDLLNTEFDHVFFENEEDVRVKQKKIEKYYKYSQDLGMVERV